MNQEKGQSDINRDRMTKEGGKSNWNETKRKSVRNFNDRKVKDKRGDNVKKKENSVHKKQPLYIRAEIVGKYVLYGIFGKSFLYFPFKEPDIF